ncbi:MAG TPA: 2-oxo-4-hydroxy-4-carboxy-5-ureidoimidazoline decarboxylase [Rhodothermales bacterium]|nr:2-oxo-4-hydroxy-4-carboxy-5-ureidoimidazoline decarboxylase [Rhodothermales bacterium]
MPVTLDDLNALDRDAFVAVVGPVFEHSPWIAARTWPARPFASREALHAALCGTVEAASREEQLGLIRAHPDLVGRAARAGTLTAASTREQAGAGLGALSPEEVTLFDLYNAAYHARFGFPFVICARENKKDAILSAFPVRLAHTAEEEVATALAEIAKIAWYRLADLVADEP